MNLSLCLEDFDMKYGLNIGFATQGSQICRKTVFLMQINPSHAIVHAFNISAERFRPV